MLTFPLWAGDSLLKDSFRGFNGMQGCVQPTPRPPNSDPYPSLDSPFNAPPLQTYPCVHAHRIRGGNQTRVPGPARPNPAPAQIISLFNFFSKFSLMVLIFGCVINNAHVNEQGYFMPY